MFDIFTIFMYIFIPPGILETIIDEPDPAGEL